MPHTRPWPSYTRAEILNGTGFGKDARFVQLTAPLAQVLERLPAISALATDEWNVDDTICQQNMAKIRALLTGGKDA